MKYKYIITIVVVSCFLLNFSKLSFNSGPKYLLVKDTLPPMRWVGFVEMYPTCFIYEDFPNENPKVIRFANIVKKEKVRTTQFYSDSYTRRKGVLIGRIEKGKIKLRKEGKWVANHLFEKYLTRVEYFKKGLRHGVYKCYNKKGDIIYKTTFKKGTGLWKVFHDNDSLYFEMYTKKGFFTDTLRLRDYKGKIVGKRLYLKDSLIYKEGLSNLPLYTDPDCGCGKL